MTGSKQTTQEKIPINLLPNLTTHEQDALNALVDRLYQQYGADLLRVVLFGSKARGDYDDESDLDVLVVVRMPEDDYWQYWNQIVDITWEIELKFRLVISLVVKNESDYVAMCEHQLQLARHIEQDGIELWTMSANETTLQPI